MFSPLPLALSLTLIGSIPAQSDDPVYSGPQPGEKLAPFKVLGFTGPQAGKQFDLIEQLGAAPTLLMFVHEVTRPAAQLMRPLDLYGSKLAADGFATHFVWLAADRSATEDRLRGIQGSLQFKSPISISLDGLEGPGSYGLNRKVALTILVAKDNKVVANFAITQPNETDAPKILEAMAKLVGKMPPTLADLGADRANMRREPTRPATDQARPAANAAEAMKRLEDEVARLKSLDQEHHARALARVAELEKLVGDLTDALNDARVKIAKLEGKPAPDPLKKPTPRAEPAAAPRDAARRAESTKDEPPKKPSVDLPGRTPMDPEIIALMRRMIQPTNDEAAVKEITESMHKWAGDNPQRKDDLKQFAVRIAHLGYGSDAAKAAIKKLAE
jgi:hypothetical protein